MTTFAHILANRPDSPLLLLSVWAVLIFSGAAHLRNTVCSSLRLSLREPFYSFMKGGSCMFLKRSTNYPKPPIQPCLLKKNAGRLGFNWLYTKYYRLTTNWHRVQIMTREFIRMTSSLRSRAKSSRPSSEKQTQNKPNLPDTKNERSFC